MHLVMRREGVGCINGDIVTLDLSMDGITTAVPEDMYVCTSVWKCGVWDGEEMCQTTCRCMCMCICTRLL